MTYKILIDGMTCAHCEERIAAALEALEGVCVQRVSRDEQCAVITSEAALPAALLRDAVQCAHEGGKYTVTEICTEDCCSGKHKARDEKERKDLMNRLKRIEGQVRGLEKMLDSDCYCTDIMTQVSAVNAALNSFNKVLLANHVRTCVADNIRSGNDAVIDELVALLQKLMR